MKRFWGFTVKEFYHIIRDKRTTAILFGIPVLQLLLFGFVITNEIKNASIAFLDLSKDQTTLQIKSKLISSGYFRLEEEILSIHQIEPVLKKGKIKLVIVFGANFEYNLMKLGKADVQIIADASEPNSASILVNYATSIINDYTSDRNKMLGKGMPVNPIVRMVFNPELKAVYMFIPGIMAMLLMLISALMTSISITREKELGTMEVLLVSPLKPVQIILGKVLPYILFAFIIAVIIITLGFTVFQMPVKGSLLLLLAESLLFIFVALALGIFISTVTNSQQVAMMLSMVALMLPTILLSGFIFPIENMPLLLQWIASAMPPKYFIVIVKAIMLKGVDITYIWKETLVLLGMLCVFLLLSAKKFKIRLS